MCLLIKKYSSVKRRAHPHTHTHTRDTRDPAPRARRRRRETGRRGPRTLFPPGHRHCRAPRDPRGDPRPPRSPPPRTRWPERAVPHTRRERALSERGTGELKRDSSRNNTASLHMRELDSHTLSTHTRRSRRSSLRVAGVSYRGPHPPPCAVCEGRYEMHCQPQHCIIGVHTTRHIAASPILASTPISMSSHSPSPPAQARRAAVATRWELGGLAERMHVESIRGAAGALNTHPPSDTP